MTTAPDAIQRIIEQALPDAKVQIQGDDGVHFEALIVSEQFINLSLLQRQQKIYALFSDWFQSGALHALTLHTFTPSEYT